MSTINVNGNASVHQNIWVDNSLVQFAIHIVNFLITFIVVYLTGIGSAFLFLNLIIIIGICCQRSRVRAELAGYNSTV